MSNDFRDKMLELMALEVKVRENAKKPLKELKKADPKWKLMPVFFIGVIVLIWSWNQFKAPNTQIIDLFVDIFCLVLMICGLCAALWGFVGVMKFIEMMRLKKENAKITEHNNFLLRSRDKEYEKFLALQKELVEIKKNTPGMEKAFYFFEAPFDRGKAFVDLNEKDTHSIIGGDMTFMSLDGALKFGCDKEQLIFKGFKDAERLKLGQLKPYLLSEDCNILYLDTDYMLEHQNDTYAVNMVWEVMMAPDYQYRTVTNYSSVNPESAMRAYERSFDDFERSVNFGFTNEEAYLSGEKSYWNYMLEADIREKAEKDAKEYIRSYNANATSADLNLVGLKLLLMNTGYVISLGKRIVALVLPNEEVALRRLEYSLFKELPFDAAPPFEGLVQKLDSKPAVPSFSNFVSYIVKEFKDNLPPFNPLSIKPEGISLEMWRGWMEEWYKAKR